MSIRDKLKNKIDILKNSPEREEYERIARNVLIESGDGDFKIGIYGDMLPIETLEYIDNIFPTIRNKIKLKANESTIEASRMLVEHVFSLENGFCDLLNGILSLNQIPLVQKIIEKIETQSDSILPSQTSRGSTSQPGCREHNSGSPTTNSGSPTTSSNPDPIVRQCGEDITSNISSSSSLSLKNPWFSIQNILTNIPVTSPTRGRSKFDGKAYMRYLQKIEISFRGITGRRYLSTFDMLRNTPVVVEVSFTNGMKTLGSKRTTDLFDLFPNGLVSGNLIAFIGEAGSGKTVYIKLLQKFFIHSQCIPFLIRFRTLIGGEQTTFAEYVYRYACPDYCIDDVESFGEWIQDNRHKILFLFDGLDEASFDMSIIVQPVDVKGRANAQTWTNLLFSGKIMVGCTVIFTSRPSSLFNLHARHIPDVIYSLEGFEGESLKMAVDLYSDAHSADIISLITSKASKSGRIIQSPFFVSLISIIYEDSPIKINSDTTLTQLYHLMFEEWRVFRHCRSESQAFSERKRVKGLVDSFFHQLWIGNVFQFTVADIRKHGLTIQHIEAFSFVNVSTKNYSLLIRDDDEVVASVHKAIAEYHAARFLMNHIDTKSFSKALDDLFSLGNQDKNTNVRRLMAGHIVKCVADKRDMFLKKLVIELKSSMSQMLVIKHKGNELIQALFLQGYLLNDLLEIPKDMMNIVREKLYIDDSKLRMQISLQDESLLNGVINFLDKVDPLLRLLALRLHKDISADDCIKFANGVANLQNKVNQMQIGSIQQVQSNMQMLANLLMKVDTALRLQFVDEVEDCVVHEIQRTLQQEINLHPDMRMFVEVRHRGYRELLRHSSYTSTRSPLILESHFKGRKMINLTKYGEEPARYEALLRENLNLKFDVVISQRSRFNPADRLTHTRNEVENLTTLLGIIPSIKLGVVEVYLSGDNQNTCMRQLCEEIRKLDYQVVQMFLYNNVGLVDLTNISHLMEYVSYSLELWYLYDISDIEKKTLKKKLESVHNLKAPTLYTSVYFKNGHIKLLPPDLPKTFQELSIST